MNIQHRPFPTLQAGEEMRGAGRVCPHDYTDSPEVFARVSDFTAETLYVVVGLYGNHAALATIQNMAAAECAQIVFNGDFHWFDANLDWFAEIEQGVAQHRALRGNVETEIARESDIGAGCGCAYPETVDEEVVRHSNDILIELAARAPAKVLARLRASPMHLVAQVGGLRIGIVHGDAAALAGWRFAPEALDEPFNPPWLNDVRTKTQIDLFASTHTCLAALRDFTLAAGRLTVINNGAAGLPNFFGSRFGLITRIAVTPSSHTPLYGLARDGVYIDALAVPYDQDAFLERFAPRWPPGSPAHDSYFKHIAEGPDYRIARARMP